ncbi:MAG: cytochrome B [Desulfococcus sp. 4484_241]|nr:MAG: cytochrome B [Desulfococcus sp. 4484_241]
MAHKKMTNIYLFTRYERLWHWLQFVLITILMITGLEVHGVYQLLGFDKAVAIHNFAGITWLILFFFFMFWVFTTGEWKQYIPTTRKLIDVALFYAWGIFHGEPHPVPARKGAKHNPLQRLTYLGVAAALLPLQMLTGFLYWSYNSWDAWGLGFLSLHLLAVVHMAVAFAILIFVIVHVYMTTTGHTVTAHIKAMITGWEEIEEGELVQEWEKHSP